VVRDLENVGLSLKDYQLAIRVDPDFVVLKKQWSTLVFGLFFGNKMNLQWKG
jgi:hypothetical protein